jgi:uncharacterized protein (DUF2126 family)
LAAAPFVSIDDMEGDEWNIAGRSVGAPVVDARPRWRSGSHLAAYPARARQVVSRRALPRWQIAVHWRDDGGALWHDPSLLVDPLQPGG